MDPGLVEDAKVHVLGAPAPSTWTQNGPDLTVDLAQSKPSPHGLGLKHTPSPRE